VNLKSTFLKVSPRSAINFFFHCGPLDPPFHSLFTFFYLSGVEKLVLSTLTTIVDDHIPQLAKERKTLNSLLLDFDASKSRLLSHRAKEGQNSGALVRKYH